MAEPFQHFEFKVFTRTGESHRPMVSLRRNGHLGFNAAAKERFKLDRFEWATLYFDKKRRVVGIRLTKTTTGKFAVKITDRPGNFSIRAKNLLLAHDIEFSGSSRKSRRFELHRYESKAGWFYFEVNGKKEP